MVLGRAAKAGRTGEGEAREARWKFFEKAVKAVKARELWLAHQADDQAETVLMQLLRGAGPEGLAGMGESSDRGKWKVVRPLLGFSREELRQAAREAGLGWREDKTNEDEQSWRVRIRKKVFPFLAKIYGRDVRGALARTAEILTGEADYWRKEIGKVPLHPDALVVRVFVGHVFDEQHEQHVVLVLASIHAAAQLIAGGPDRGVEVRFLEGHGLNSRQFARQEWRGICTVCFVAVSSGAIPLPFLGQPIPLLLRKRKAHLVGAKINMWGNGQRSFEF